MNPQVDDDDEGDEEGDADEDDEGGDEGDADEDDEGGDADEGGDPHAVLNVIMADASGSMCRVFGAFVGGWNALVAPRLLLLGGAEAFSFGRAAVRRRRGPVLLREDLLGGPTDLALAVQKMSDVVHSCPEASVNAFFVTDGLHAGGFADPEGVVRSLTPPEGKVVNVFVLAFGEDFPVGLSDGLRRGLHNGRPDLPPIFWARNQGQLYGKLAEIAQFLTLKGTNGLGSAVKGAPRAPRALLPKEDAYFDESSLRRPPSLSLISPEGPRPSASRAPTLSSGPLKGALRRQGPDVRGKKGGKGPLNQERGPFPNPAFGSAAGRLRPDGRRGKKRLLKEEEAEFRALIKASSSGRSLEGHDDEDDDDDDGFREDLEDFLRVLDPLREEALALQGRSRGPVRALLTEVLDPDFRLLALMGGRFAFLNAFKVPGIPIRASFCHVGSPWNYEILALAGDDDDDVSESSRVAPDPPEGAFRAIVPVFPEEALKVLGPLMRTRLFASCASFCVLRNPHVVDFQVHLAALASTWAHIQGVKGGLEGGPELLGRLEGTAGVYLLREGASSFFGPPSEAPKGAPSRFRACPSLLKPLFLLALDEGFRAEAGREGVDALFGGLLVEFVGRMASKRGPRAPPLLVLRDLDQVLGGPPSRAEGWALLGAFDTPEGLRKWARRAAPELASRLLRSTGVESIVAVDPRRLEGLREPSGLGWRALRAVGARLGVPDALFGPRRALEYAALGLLRRRRLREAPPPPEDPVSGLLKEGAPLRGSLVGALRARFGASWLRAFREAHQEELALPLTLREAALEAPDASFGASFRRRLGLVAGACQCPKCPHFLLPKRRFNQHASVGRRSFAPLLREGERRAFLREEEEGRPFAHRLHALAFAFRHSRDLGQALSCLLKANPGKKFSPDHLRTIEGHLRGLQTIYREMASEEGHEGHIEDNKTVDQGPPN